MVKHPLWSDEDWLLLMQLYIQKPAGVKALYSKGLIDLSLELHIPPTYLYKAMFHIHNQDLPSVNKLWKTYSHNHKKLNRMVDKLRQMKGFNHFQLFYEDVPIHHTFEKDFLPISNDSPLTPMMLIIILDLYFRLTPNTMRTTTPEIQELATLMHISERVITEVMDVFQYCDPYLNRNDIIISPLLQPCHDIWQRYGNGNPLKLAALAAQLKEYFR